MNLKYKKEYLISGQQSQNLSFGEALSLVLEVYKDCDMTRDMLTIPNRIRLTSYSNLVVYSDEEANIAPEILNALPFEYSYDDDGKRL